MDFPTPSRWSKGTADEFRGSVFEDCEYAKKNILGPLREAYSGPIGVIEGNHDERPRTYLKTYAPALAESKAFDLDVLLDFEKFGITLLPEFYEFAPGWLATHGHRAGIRLNQTAGLTALNAARKVGKNVVMGHVHRLGRISYSEGYGGEVTRTLTGLEVGNVMDMRLAGYLKGGTANWQQGFGVIHVDGDYVNAMPVPIQGKKFTVDGNVYKF